MLTVNCRVCNKAFKTYPCKIAGGKGKYCSKECAKVTLIKKGQHISPSTELKKGMKLPENWKAKMRGRKAWNFNTKGLVKPNSGSFRPGEHRSPTTEYRIGTPMHLHPRWEGGKSFEPYPLTWTSKLREMIRARDGYVCKSCGVTQSECFQKLHVHHIDYNKLNVLESNLISLCRSCHLKTNNNRNVWLCFFKEVMSNAHCR